MQLNGNLGKAIYVNDLMASRPVPTFCQWGGGTLNTPYKAGITQAAEGFAICFGDPSTYMTIAAWTKGGVEYYIGYHINGVFKGWDRCVLSSDMTNALQGYKIRMGTKQLTFSSGSAMLDLSSSGFTDMPTVICQIVDNASAAVIAGCNPQSATAAKIGARTIADGAVFNGTVWVRYIAVGA